VRSLDVHEDIRLESPFPTPEDFLTQAGKQLDEWSRLAAEVDKEHESKDFTEQIIRAIKSESGRVQEGVVARVDNLRPWLAINFRYLGILVLIAVLNFILLTVVVSLWIARLWPDNWPSLARWIRSRTSSKGLEPPKPAEAVGADGKPAVHSGAGPKETDKLREVLAREGINLDTLDSAAGLLEKIRAKLARIAGLDPQHISIEQAIEGIEKSLASMKVKGREPANLADAAKLFGLQIALLKSCKDRIDMIPGAERAPAPTWAEPEFATYLEEKSSAIASIKEKLSLLNVVVGCFEQLGYGEKRIQSAAEQAVSLCRKIQGELSTQRLDFEGAQTAFERLGAECLSLAEFEPETLHTAVSAVTSAWTRLSEQQTRIDDLKRDASFFDEVFLGLRQEKETSLDTARRVAKEPASALLLLKGIRGLEPGNLVAGVSKLVQWLESLEQRIRTAVPEAPESLYEAVGALVAKYEALVGSVESNARLVKEFGAYLHLRQVGRESADEVQKTIDHLRAETEGAHRSLRLGLASALAAWKEGVERLRYTARLDVLDALRLGEVEKELWGLLERIESKTDETLGADLENGFPQDWLHQLFRAEVLLDTYFADLEPCAVLRDAVKLACGTVRVALQHFDCRVLRFELLKPNPQLRVSEKRIQLEKDAPSELRRIHEVRELVLPYLDSGSKSIFVDIRSFVYLKGGEENWHFEVVGITPADWRA
jgi:hypothetical protein